MSGTVRELNQHFIDIWWECGSDLPDLGPRYTARDQTQNEKHLLRFLEEMDRAFSHSPRNQQEAQDLKSRLGAGFRCLAEETLGFRSAQLNLLPSQTFSDASEEFVRMARTFDAKLSVADIYQAGRNAWTANGLQWLMGLSVQVTPSIFAYSLLYPYTDNYLDDPSIDIASKVAFNERLRQRLTGSLLAPASPYEKVIFDLVAMIEKQYSRAEDPDVFERLLAIHRAQGRSLKLIRLAAPGEVDVIGLSFEKGGTSVLADGFLVNPSLDEAQQAYTYGHGIFAQLLDDMEDVEQDTQAGRLTVYSQPAGHWRLDALANRTFHFGQNVLLQLSCFNVNDAVRELICRGADLLLLDTISRTEQCYSESYLRELESHSPFRFSFLKEQRDRFFRRYGSLTNLMETALLFQRS